LETQLALRAYFLNHHAYPQSLTQLTPSYIPSVPVDPFSNGNQLTYKLNDTHYLLYSVGPDATDDGGKPIDNKGLDKYMLARQIHDPTYNPAAKGDIVAGVNE